jgi:metal-responsive CopG/Arc/MetJ family transcriptional regulator
VPTTIHIPDPLLERVDARAKTLGISRNRLILEALEEKAKHVVDRQSTSTRRDPDVAAISRRSDA